ncbi:50S ribosomal protein L19e [Candidatus Micrarchaeota archaeon]|nr:50S ribosomal protein L19e [Candidatus Micrarchaeota archaeon]
MSADTIKRLAADILKVGKNRVRIKMDEYSKAMEALTREDVRGLIAEGTVYKERYVGPRSKPERKNKGVGKRRGKKYSRKSAKETWMEKLRAQRKYLAEMIEGGEVPKESKRKIYLKIKGGSFKGKKALRVYLEENGMLNEKAAKPIEKKEPAKKKAEAPKKAAPRKAEKKPVAKKK